jgi:hypothetical protein
MLETRADGLQVSLFDDQGRQLEERFLPGPMTCAESGRLAAALLATWETSLVPPELPAAIPAGSPVVPPQQQAGQPNPAKPGEPRWQGEIGLGFSGSLASDGAGALGGELLASLGPPSGSYGGELTFAGTGYRSLPVGNGTASWQRFALGLGGYGRLGSGPLKLELGGQFLFAILDSKGQGFATTRTDQAFDPGIGLSSRALWRFAPSWWAWLQLGVSFWPKTQEVQVLTGATTVTATQVPPVDLSLTLGLSLAGGL